MSAMPDVGRRRLLRCVVLTCACWVSGMRLGRAPADQRLGGADAEGGGPDPVDASDFPFIADGFGPEPRVPSGYEENEYFVSGRAKLYEYSASGVRVIAPCPASAGRRGCRNLPYTTRMLVKRPIDPHGFSGTVIIEPFNPSSGYDIANVWDRSWPYFVGQGDVFVGWTSRYESIRALKRFEPRRYARLAWGANSAVDDGITFDIAAQVGALFKLNGPRSPLHRLKVRHVFEAGFSQDGAFTFTQADVFNAIDRLPNGGPVYDGYVPGGTVGPSDINFGLTAAGSLPSGDPRNRMQRRDSPVTQINTETEEVSSALRRHWPTADPTTMPATIDTGCGRCRAPATSPMISAACRSPRNETWRKSSGSRRAHCLRPVARTSSIRAVLGSAWIASPTRTVSVRIRRRCRLRRPDEMAR